MNGDEVPKTPLRMDKQLIFALIVAVVFLGAGAWLYFGGSVNFLNKDTVSGRDLEIICEDFDGLPQLEIDDINRRLNEISASKRLTKEDLARLLPQDCRIVGSEPGVSPGTCLILEEQYCSGYQKIQFVGREAYVFNLPEGAPVFSPFDGAFFLKPYGGSEDIQTIDLGIVHTSSFVTLIGDIQPRLGDAQFVSKGDWIAAMSTDNGPVAEEGNYNLIIYATDYDLAQYFR